MLLKLPHVDPETLAPMHDVATTWTGERIGGARFDRALGFIGAAAILLLAGTVAVKLSAPPAPPLIHLLLIAGLGIAALVVIVAAWLVVILDSWRRTPVDLEVLPSILRYTEQGDAPIEIEWRDVERLRVQLLPSRRPRKVFIEIRAAGSRPLVFVSRPESVEDMHAMRDVLLQLAESHRIAITGV